MEDFFKTRGDEVRKVMHFDMTWERREELIREEERAGGSEEGRVEGREEGRGEGEMIKLIRLVQRKVKRGKVLSEMADELEETEEVLCPILDAIQEKGVDQPAEEIYAYYKEKSLRW